MKIKPQDNGLFYGDDVDLFVATVFEEGDTIDYASRLQHSLKKYVSFLKSLLKLKGKGIMIDAYENDEEDTININNLFSISLTEEDFINIANLMYPNEYDRVMTLHANYVGKYRKEEGHGKNFSWWEEFYEYSYRVIARKNVQLDMAKKYSSCELKALIESRDILIIQAIREEVFKPDDNMCIVDCLDTQKVKIILNPDKNTWLVHICNPKNMFYKCYVSYIMECLKPYIDELFSILISKIKDLLRCPGDNEIKRWVNDDAVSYASLYNKVSKTKLKFIKSLSVKQRLEYVKKYEEENGIVKTAIEIVMQYSKEYKSIKHLLALET